MPKKILVCQTMIRLTLIPFAFMLFAMSCQSQKQGKEADHFILKGKLENADQVVLLLQELTTRELATLDSFCTDESGMFAFRGKAEEAGFYILRIDDSNYITLLIEPGEELFISGDANNLAHSYAVDGSEGSSLLADYYRGIRSNNERLDSLREEYNAKRHTEEFAEIRDELKAAFKALFSDQQRYVKHFIKKNPKSLASIIALYQYFGNRLLMHEEEHFSYFESLSGSLSEIYPTNKHVMDLNRRVSQQKRITLRRNMLEDDIAVGNKAPDIVLPDLDGNVIALSSLRGQYVLIDFWASWCNPCRKANHELRSIYDQYNGYGFEIYGISLDRTFEQWKQGIVEDGVTWTQVSDLRLWNSPVVSLYGVERIPLAILIDPKGKIINKNISTKELEEFLAEKFDSKQILALP